jgi:hypothetical protein
VKVVIVLLLSLVVLACEPKVETANASVEAAVSPVRLASNSGCDLYYVLHQGHAVYWSICLGGGSTASVAK